MVNEQFWSCKILIRNFEKKQNSTQHMFLISSEENFRVNNNIPQGW